VHAVDIYFNEDGSYLNYDLTSPLARTGGKALVVSSLKGQASIVMVGDGKTDLEAKQAGAYVVGFGGVVKREIVRNSADFYTTEPTLLSVLEHIL
jgi:phosphoserine phosphatase